MGSLREGKGQGMSRQAGEQIKPQQLARIQQEAPGLAAYLEARRARGTHYLGRRWHRGS
jgi:hypothetical protein